MNYWQDCRAIVSQLPNLEWLENPVQAGLFLLTSLLFLYSVLPPSVLADLT